MKLTFDVEIEEANPQSFNAGLDSILRQVKSMKMLITEDAAPAPEKKRAVTPAPVVETTPEATPEAVVEDKPVIIPKDEVDVSAGVRTKLECQDYVFETLGMKKTKLSSALLESFLDYPFGVSAKELSDATGIPILTISSWFNTTAKKIPPFTKLSRGMFKFDRTQVPAA